jgi:hypothetical protein
MRQHIKSCIDTEQQSNASIDIHFIDVAPPPVLSPFCGLDNRVMCRTEMLACMLILRRVAAADMTAFETHTQVNPGIPDPETVFTALGGWLHRFDVFFHMPTG